VPNYFDARATVHGVVSWTRYMNQSLCGADAGGGAATDVDDLLCAFHPAAAAAGTRERPAADDDRASSPAFSTIDLGQLGAAGVPAGGGAAPGAAAAPDLTVDRQRLSGLPLKHRYKQSARAVLAGSSCCRR